MSMKGRYVVLAQKYEVFDSLCCLIRFISNIVAVKLPFHQKAHPLIHLLKSPICFTCEFKYFYQISLWLYRFSERYFVI